LSIGNILFNLFDYNTPLAFFYADLHILLIFERETVVCRNYRGDRDIPRVARTDRDDAPNTFLYHMFSIV